MYNIFRTEEIMIVHNLSNVMNTKSNLQFRGFIELKDSALSEQKIHKFIETASSDNAFEMAMLLGKLTDKMMTFSALTKLSFRALGNGKVLPVLQNTWSDYKHKFEEIELSENELTNDDLKTLQKFGEKLDRIRPWAIENRFKKEKHDWVKDSAFECLP